MSAPDIAARGLAARALRAGRALSSSAGAANIGTGDGGNVQESLEHLGIGNACRVDLRAFRDGVGQGDETADTEALHAAWASAGATGAAGIDRASGISKMLVTLPPGELLLGDSLLGSEIAGTTFSFAFKGSGGTGTRIRLTDPAVFMCDVDAGKIIASALFEDLQIVGGAGVLVERETGSAVGPRTGGGGIVFHRCGIFNHSKMALGSASVNSPLWHVYKCQILGGDDSIGAVIPGGTGQYLRDTFIAGHKYGVVMRDSGEGCVVDGLRFGGQAGTDRVDLVIEPHAANNFRRLEYGAWAGNETDSPGDIEILCADLDMSGGPENMVPKATKSTGYVRAHLRGSFVGGDARVRGLIVSRTENLVLTGEIDADGTYPWVVEFDTAVIPSISLGNAFAQLSDLKVHSPGEQFQHGRRKTRWCNLPGFGFGSGQMLAGEPSVPQPVAGGPRVSLMSRTMAELSAGTSTLGPLTSDSMGGTDAREATFAAGTNGRFWQQLDLTGAVAGELAWAEFDLKQASSQPMSEIMVAVGAAYNAFFRSVKLPVPVNWRRFSFPFIVPATGSTLVLAFRPITPAYSAGVSDTLTVGRIDVYQAPWPVAA